MTYKRYTYTIYYGHMDCQLWSCLLNAPALSSKRLQFTSSE